MRSRAMLAAIAAATVATAGLTLPALGRTAHLAGAAGLLNGVATAPKIVIVVGTVEDKTSAYRTEADKIYAEAIKYTPNVVRVYSPNATWPNVRAAAQGATIFIYSGHGYGFPSPYRPVLSPDVQDGMGLNLTAGNGDSNKKYYGESFIASEIRLAKNAFVILRGLCYAPGGSESGHPEPTPAVARERIDNFASGFIRAGARAVMADNWSGAAIAAIRGIFTSHQSLRDLWLGLPGGNGNEQFFIPNRNRQFLAAMDPDTPTTGYHRSIVGNLDLHTDDVLAGADASATDAAPAVLEAPGAAVSLVSLALYADATLATATGRSVGAGTKLRVDEIDPAEPGAGGTTPPLAVRVSTLDGAVSGWVAANGLGARDSSPPQLWAVDGPTAITPNADGSADQLGLMLRFSEPVSWSFRILDGAGTQLRLGTGAGPLLWLTWDGLIGGAPAPAGDYTWAIRATDAWGNPALEATGSFSVAYPPVPSTGVLSFVPTMPAPTNAATIGYALTFAAPVTGLGAADFSVTGSAPYCAVGTPVGAGTAWSLTVSGCGTGSLVLVLNPFAVVDAASAAGPAGPIAAPAMLIDRTRPTTTAPTVSVRTDTSPSASTSGSVQAMIRWTGSDTGGAGVAYYDVQRSLDGGAFADIARGVIGTALNVSLSPGHSYAFRVRARDRAMNPGAYATSATWRPARTQNSSTSLRYAGTWRTGTSTLYSGGSVRYATAAGASVSYTFSGRAIAWLATTGPDKGAVQVYVDGVLAGTVDLYAPSTAVRSVVFSRSWTGYATHTIRLVVLGTAGRPRADVDAFELVR